MSLFVTYKATPQNYPFKTYDKMSIDVYVPFYYILLL